MRKYYTRPCNFYYGKQAKKLIKNKKGLSLAGNPNIAFDQVEIFQRKNKKLTISNFYSLDSIQSLNAEKRKLIKNDLQTITSKRKSILNLQFDKPQIMGVLNITPDSFSDGGLFFKEKKAYTQVELMLRDGSKIIDIGGESTRPGSKTISEKVEWDRVKNIIIKLKKKIS